MSKKSIKQIKTYYKDSDVVKTYDSRRFSGVGGQYINDNEVNPVLNLTKKPKTKILDVGSGRGRLSIPLKNNNHKLFCLDSSDEMIKELGKHFSKKNLIKQSIFDKIKTNEKFDYITSLRFFDHFSLSDQKKILKNLKSNLNSNGRIIVPTLNRNSSEGLLAKVFPYGRYNYFFSYSEYKEAFESVGLSIVDFDSSFFLPRGLFLKFNSFLPALSILLFFDSILSKVFKKTNSYYYFSLESKANIK